MNLASSSLLLVAADNDSVENRCCGCRLSMNKKPVVKSWNRATHVRSPRYIMVPYSISSSNTLSLVFSSSSIAWCSPYFVLHTYQPSFFLLDAMIARGGLSAVRPSNIWSNPLDLLHGVESIEIQWKHMRSQINNIKLNRTFPTTQKSRGRSGIRGEIMSMDLSLCKC